MTADEKTANDKRIHELSKAPPVVLITRRAKVLAIARNVAAVVAFVAMGLGLFLLQQQNQANHQAAQNNLNTQIAVCKQSNQARAQVATLWQYIIDLSKKNNPNPTARQAQALADFQRKVNDTYAPRDCSHPGK